MRITIELGEREAAQLAALVELRNLQARKYNDSNPDGRKLRADWTPETYADLALYSALQDEARYLLEAEHAA